MLLAAAALTAAVVSSCFAANRGRDFSVALAILAGDARQLADPGTPLLRRTGLRERIASSLSSLNLLARQYLQQNGEQAPRLLTEITQMRSEFRASRLRAFARRAAALARRYPLNLAGLRPEDARPQDVVHGREIYRHLCLGCHAYPDRDRANPAPNLFRMAHRLPEREFVARLVGGIHGKPAVALRNPLSDAEIAGLAAYLRRSSPNP